MYTKALKAHNLTYTQYIVMMYFWNVGASNLTDVSKALMLDASTLSPLLNKLQCKGLIKKQRSSKDKRNLLICLTDKGRDLEQQVADIPEQVAKRVGLNQEESEILRVIAGKALGSIRELRSEEND